uniref:C2H2-type domain-containing protein n=1 Tax=Trichuris muris TaxID=70415 RepID=A0A5S6QG69_TRIMR
MANLSVGSSSDDDFDVLPEDQEIPAVEELNHQVAGSVDWSLMNSILGLKCNTADVSVHDGRISSTPPPVDNDLDMATADLVTPDGAESLNSSYSLPLSNVSASLASTAVKNAAAIQLRHVEGRLSKVELMMEALKEENVALSRENEDHRAGLASFAEVVSSLQRQVEELLKENNELKEICFSYERRERLREEMLDQLKQDLSKLQSLNIALQLQVEEDGNHVIALKDRHHIELELLADGVLTREEDAVQLHNSVRAFHSSEGYQCEGCSVNFGDEESFLIHLHCCSKFQELH